MVQNINGFKAWMQPERKESITLEQILNIIQTEADGRRREAGVQKSKENGRWSCMYVYLYVCTLQGSPKRMETFIFCVIEKLPN